MTKSIPEIDDLIKGINDTDLALGNQQVTGNAESATPPQETPIPEEATDNSGMERCWANFIANLDRTEAKEGREERLVCKIDRDLADSLDDCDINNLCRSALVNAIVRAFFDTYLPQLATYRREKKSLFNNFKEE